MVKKTVITLAVLVSGVAGCTAAMDDTSSDAPVRDTSAEVVTEDSAPAKAEKSKPEPKPAPEFTKAQEQAIGTAQDYLDYAAFSAKGLVEQLEYEGFSNADATFAVNHIDVDWNAQAAKSAKDYLDYSHFSRSGLIEQLEYEGFTHAQAVHGTNKAGL